MQHDPARVAETREWLEKVALDVRGARVDLDATPPLLEDALFHCQQAVEKALKGFLAWHDVPFRMACEQVDATLKAVVDPAVPLTEFAWAFRYPGDHPTPTLEEARQGYDTTRRTVAAVVARLPKEAVPNAHFGQCS